MNVLAVTPALDLSAYAPRPVHDETVASYLARLADHCRTDPGTLTNQLAAVHPDRVTALMWATKRDLTHLNPSPMEAHATCSRCDPHAIATGSHAGLWCLKHRHPRGFTPPANLDLARTITAERRYRAHGVGVWAPVGSHAFFVAAAAVIHATHRQFYTLPRALTSYPRIIDTLTAARSYLDTHPQPTDDQFVEAVSRATGLTFGRFFILPALPDALDFQSRRPNPPARPTRGTPVVPAMHVAN